MHTISFSHTAPVSTNYHSRQDVHSSRTRWPQSGSLNSHSFSVWHWCANISKTREFLRSSCPGLPPESHRPPATYLRPRVADEECDEVNP